MRSLADPEVFVSKLLHVLAHGLAVLLDIAGRNKRLNGRAGHTALGNASTGAGAVFAFRTGNMARRHTSQTNR